MQLNERGEHLSSSIKRYKMVVTEWQTYGRGHSRQAETIQTWCIGKSSYINSDAYLVNSHPH
jgi:hypothetical protein